MNILYSTYTFLTSGLALSCFPPFWFYSRMSGRFHKSLKERLGYVAPGTTQALSGSPRIWVQAVSLGEVKVAEPIIRALQRAVPGCSVILSTTTEHGRDLAVETFGDGIPVIYAPIDFIGSVRKALFSVRPDVMVFLETEIWPVWIVEAQRMGIKIALVNGRVSPRSIGRYIRLKPFFRHVLGSIDTFSMITEGDSSRIISMGADPKRVVVNGNAKYDLLTDLADPAKETEMRQILNLGPSRPVFVAGSTRTGEEDIIIDAYERIEKEFPDMILIIAPRHIERAQTIASLLEERGFRYQLRSRLNGEAAKRREKIIIMDSFGELFKLYSVSTIAFCGGSLMPLGGQNPLEAAVWGKPVFYGPFMEDFQDAKALLEKNKAGIEVSGSEMLAKGVLRFLRDPNLRKRYGARARKAVIGNGNAAERHAEVIKELINNK